MAVVVQVPYNGQDHKGDTVTVQWADQAPLVNPYSYRVKIGTALHGWDACLSATLPSTQLQYDCVSIAHRGDPGYRVKVEYQKFLNGPWYSSASNNFICTAAVRELARPHVHNINIIDTGDHDDKPKPPRGGRHDRTKALELEWDKNVTHVKHWHLCVADETGIRQGDWNKRNGSKGNTRRETLLIGELGAAREIYVQLIGTIDTVIGKDKIEEYVMSDIVRYELI